MRSTLKSALTAVLAAVALASTLAACGGGGSSPSSSSSQQQTPTHHGGNLTFARAFEPVTFNPLKTNGDNGSLWDMVQIYDQLVEYQPGSLDVQPGLAQSWSIS